MNNYGLGALVALFAKIPSVSPVFSADPAGAPLDSIFVVSSPSYTAGDILWSIDTTYAKAIFFSVDATASGYSLALEWYDSKGAWNILNYTRITNLTNGVGNIAQTGNYAANIYGAQIVRLRVVTAGSLTSAAPVISSVRTLSEALPDVVVGLRITNYPVLADAALGAPLTVTSNATYFCGFTLSNNTASDRWAHISNSGVYSGPILIPAKQTVNVGSQGLGSIAITGLAFKATTNVAGTTYATPGDVTGMIRHGIC